MESKKTFSRIGWSFFVGSVIIFVLQYLCVLIVRGIDRSLVYDDNISLLMSVLPLYLAGFPVIVLLTKNMPKVNIKKRTMSLGKFVIAFMMTYAIMLCSNLLGNMITSIISLLKKSDVENVVAGAIGSTNLLLLFVYMVICAPIMEELIFRKLLVDRTLRFGQGVPIVLSGLMFGLFHGNLNQFAYAFTIGMFFAFLYIKTGNIKYTIAIHMIINFIGSILSILILSGILDDLYYLQTASDAEMMEPVTENAGEFMLYLLYVLVLFGIAVAGLVLFIISAGKRRFKLYPGAITIPKGKRFATVIGNSGMIFYCLFWIVMIIWQLIA